MLPPEPLAAPLELPPELPLLEVLPPELPPPELVLPLETVPPPELALVEPEPPELPLLDSPDVVDEFPAQAMTSPRPMTPRASQSSHAPLLTRAVKLASGCRATQ